VDFYEYFATYVDDLLYACRNGQALFDELKKSGYKLKDVEALTYQRSGDVKRVIGPDAVLTWGSHTLPVCKVLEPV
jgi:hypothetical protein